MERYEQCNSTCTTDCGHCKGDGPPRYVLVIDEPTEYVDRTLQTASWWDKYTLQPGEYPIEFVTIDHRPLREGQRPYYAKVVVDATLDETYRVNRVFTASSSEHEHPGTRTTKTFDTYAYMFDPDMVVKYGAPMQYLGRVVGRAPAQPAAA